MGIEKSRRTRVVEGQGVCGAFGGLRMDGSVSPVLRRRRVVYTRRLEELYGNGKVASMGLFQEYM